MADPTIQTFCCHRGRFNVDMGVKIMSEFNTHSYNIVCLCSSLIGILGALYQILPKEEIAYQTRPQLVTRTRGQNIIKWLAVADLLASLGVFTRSIVWINFKNIMPVDNDTADVLFCAFTSAWTQYFYTATWLWTMVYAIDMYLLIHEKDSHSNVYHALCWGLPAAMTAAGLSILYIPDANCHDLSSQEIAFTRILPNYFATYIPIVAVMIVNPVLYFLSCNSMEELVYRITSQLTRKERDILDSLKLKFFLINIVFYMCWLPNIINGVLLWVLWFDLPVKAIIIIWYTMAMLNPLQALMNAIVYRRWTQGAQKFKYIPNIRMFLNKNKDDEILRTPLIPRQPSRLLLNDNPAHTSSSM